MTAYDVLFERVLTRVDAERAHHLGFRAVRAGRPLSRALIHLASTPVEAMRRGDIGVRSLQDWAALAGGRPDGDA